jgi:hypothetical protein
MEGGKMRVGIVVDDEVNAFHELTVRHREIALDYNRNHSAVLRHHGHVEVDVTAPDGTIAEEIFENAGDFLVGDFGIYRTEREARGAGELGPGDKTSCENAGGSTKEAAAGRFVVR